MELKGKTAVITGSSGQLGGAIAMALGSAGCNCICHYNTNTEAASELVERIRSTGAEAIAVCADLTEPKQIEELFERACEFTTPQILINSAAIFSRLPLSDVSFEQAQKVFNINLTAPILAGRVFAEKIRTEFTDARGVIGKIINITDVGAIGPWAEYVLYCSSKAGLVAATKSLAKELAPRICVNVVDPGIVTWPDDFNQIQKDRQLAMIPAGRIAKPGEVADAVIFLLKNDYITAEILKVDGGRSSFS